jgi:hypothetical protein
MGVGVTVPGPHAGGRHWKYEAMVKMTWYRTDGSIQGRSTHGVDYAREIPPDAVFEAPCVSSQPPSD